tara:strand:+ start:31144 stop:31308 length:165 start_codon:yes stop_codon:yes gene_type:complete
LNPLWVVLIPIVSGAGFFFYLSLRFRIGLVYVISILNRFGGLKKERQKEEEPIK